MRRETESKYFDEKVGCLGKEGQSIRKPVKEAIWTKSLVSQLPLLIKPSAHHDLFWHSWSYYSSQYRTKLLSLWLDCTQERMSPISIRATGLKISTNESQSTTTKQLSQWNVSLISLIVHAWDAGSLNIPGRLCKRYVWFWIKKYSCVRPNITKSSLQYSPEPLKPQT